MRTDPRAAEGPIRGLRGSVRTDTRRGDGSTGANGSRGTRQLKLEHLGQLLLPRL